jgi:hypothetical protein
MAANDGGGARGAYWDDCQLVPIALQRGKQPSTHLGRGPI